MKPTKSLFILVFVSALLVGTLIPITGQSETIITVGLQEWQMQNLGDKLFDDFEADHPGVKVVMVNMGNDAYLSGAAYDGEKFFERSQSYAQKADVVYLSDYNMAPESIRAGHLLNLEPLISGDPDFDEADFFPSVWNSVAWDGGVWAVPVSVSVEMLLYNAAAFDEAGLTYPDESWTLAEFANAARELAEVGEDGKVITPGLLNWNLLPFLVSLTGASFVDETVTPAVPDFSNPEIIAFLEQWRALEKEGIVAQYGDFDYERVPMRVEGLWRLSSPVQDEDDTAVWKATLLPRGRAVVRFEGFGVSGLTDKPELAYELVEYMSKSPLVTSRFYGNSPARKSLVGVEVEDQMFFGPTVTPEMQALIDQGLENGVSVNETRYGEYVLWATNTRFEDGNEIPAPEDLTVAIEEAKTLADQMLASAEQQRSNNNVLAVATPVPTPVLSSNEIALNFRVGVPYSPLPNREQWDQLVADFAASDPDVGNINLISGFGPDSDEVELDCYYDAFTNVQGMDLSTVINIDPFTDVDPNFDEGDFVTGVLNNVSRDDKIWAYPIALQPSILQYNTDIFEQAGLTVSESGWTIDEFLYALQTLLDSDIEGVDTPFIPQDGNNTYLFMLMAAYGTIPVDYSTQPSTVKLVENIDGIRHILNMAKDGLIDYRELDNMSGGFGGGPNMAIVTTSFTSLAFSLQYQLQNTDSEFVEPFAYIPYPVGSQFTPVSYSTGNAFINNTAQNPEACYRWISTIAQHPELLLGMPVRNSQLNDPALADSVTPAVASMFKMIGEQLNGSNVVVIPDAFSGVNTFTGYVENIWMNQAFDNYILKDADLETELMDAERKITELRACTAEYPELTPAELQEMSQEEITAYYDNTRQCIIAVDPSLESRFSPPPDQGD